MVEEGALEYTSRCPGICCETSYLPGSQFTSIAHITGNIPHMHVVLFKNVCVCRGLQQVALGRPIPHDR
ncbi:hypothetical protein CONPUDRAFT_84706 [Coniophora puteana RWD-64-598 SS2]|uniref:Uncharacterized protein n=1 Tax=Coniophora puteana (strain RWD-64-598) TaxID=741705 RepID=A0A5M3MD92_CONPW|nr:uncharacterized protein CONPUDRAFT_84706 [Coniophora puteana RWD-64-598 SS2]EIW76830.1 hypothetical protein CONPUDRAFT_84706 [Coniophora puteana RWD-64-598 SS2]